MAKRKAVEKVEETKVVIRPMNERTVAFRIRGTSPLVLNAMSQKALNQIKKDQENPEEKKRGKKHEAKDFKAMFQGARHISRQGWDGFPASAIRTGAIDACRLVGYKMTLAKMSFFVKADGFDRVSGQPLIKITKGKPRYVEHYVRVGPNKDKADIHARPMWDEGWEAIIRIKYDADQFDEKSVASLLMRVGAQVGIGEGRAFSKSSAGMGWGEFEIIPMGRK